MSVIPLNIVLLLSHCVFHDTLPPLIPPQTHFSYSFPYFPPIPTPLPTHSAAS